MRRIQTLQRHPERWIYTKRIQVVKNTNKSSAAQSVSRTSGAQSSTKGKAKFSKRQVAVMSDLEYYKQQDEIMDLPQSGKVLYDVSGAAI